MQPQAVAGPTDSLVRPPRIQLGDAPLAGFPGSEHDRITVLWETRDETPGEHFEAAVRRLGTATWDDVGPVSTRSSSTGDRLIHSVDITGLAWASAYEYRISRVVDGATVQTWVHDFTTRLEAGDPHAFAFAAYGDSAWAESVASFDEVQSRIGGDEAAFTLLLGDNAYMHGTEDQLDVRFDPGISPSSAALLAGHVEHAAFGNHDVHTGHGAPAEDAFANPIPVRGVTSSVDLPAGERPEHNYSFDYGNAHFVTFDSNAIESPSRLDALLDWVVADLAASDATWKIVFVHHPIGAPDKADELSEHPYYARRLIRRLADAGVDLLLTGHSHTFSWSYPLSGLRSGEPRFVEDDDGRYRQGDGVVQVVSGVGGHSVREVTYEAPFIAESFTAITDPEAAVGFALVSVSPLELTVRYVAAADGRVIGAFSIVIPVPAFGHGVMAR